MISGEPGRLGQMNDPAQSQVAGQVEAILVPTESGKTRSYGLPEALGIPKVSQNQDAAIAFVKWFTSKQFQMENYANGVLPTRTSALAELNEAGKLRSGDVAGRGVQDRRAALRAGHADLVSAVLERGEHRHQWRRQGPDHGRSGDEEHRRRDAKGDGAMTAVAVCRRRGQASRRRQRRRGPRRPHWWRRSSSPWWRWSSSPWAKRSGTACIGSIRCRRAALHRAGQLHQDAVRRRARHAPGSTPSSMSSSPSRSKPSSACSRRR